MIHCLVALILLTLTASAQFGQPRDLAFWGKRESSFSPQDITSLWMWAKSDSGYVLNAGHAPIGNLATDPNYWTNYVGGFEMQSSGTQLIYYLTNGLGQIKLSPGAGFPGYFAGNPALTNSQPLTIFAMVQFATNTTQAQIFFSSGNTTVEEVYLGADADGWIAGATGGGIASAAGLIVANKWYWVTYVANGASSSVRVNSTSVASGAIGAGKLINVKLGKNLNDSDGSFGLIGRLSEVLVYTNAALNASQIANVEGYLTNKYWTAFGLTP